MIGRRRAAGAGCRRLPLSSGLSDRRSGYTGGSPYTAAGAATRCATRVGPNGLASSSRSLGGRLGRDQFAFGGELGLVEPGVQPVARQQLGVPADLDEAAVGEHTDQIG